MADQEASLKTYRGNCQCAAYVYEITLPEIKDASECNCSICYKKAALWVFPKPKDVKFVKGDPSTLSNYTFGKKMFSHKFCPTCGHSIMVVGHLEPPKPGEDKEPENGINIRLLQHGQVDPWAIPVKTFDGKNIIKPGYEEPQFTGPEPTAEVENGQLYTGSCHCGAVKVAMKMKTLDKDSASTLTMCNCSSCGKAGAIWGYPNKPQVTLQGEENLSRYLFGNKTAGKMFCKICGVLVYNHMMTFTEEEKAAMTEENRAWVEGGKDLMPINLRVIHGLDMKDWKIPQFDGYTKLPPPYVEP
ncbi:glutathione-dependent formaldehyde-activating enzyme [Xylariaceae sp. FL0255]|nr:glutathione-dependent formaldehyde-activating enzyme [Xylariaceae sp. FL0255]